MFFHLRLVKIVFILLLVLAVSFCCAPGPGREPEQEFVTIADSIPGWPRDVRKVEIPSSYDHSLQPALFWRPSQTDGPCLWPCIPGPGIICRAPVQYSWNRPEGWAGSLFILISGDPTIILLPPELRRRWLMYWMR